MLHLCQDLILNINFLNDSQKHWSWDYFFFKLLLLLCVPILDHSMQVEVRGQ